MAWKGGFRAYLDAMVSSEGEGYEIIVMVLFMRMEKVGKRLGVGPNVFGLKRWKKPPSHFLGSSLGFFQRRDDIGLVRRSLSKTITLFPGDSC